MRARLTQRDQTNAVIGLVAKCLVDDMKDRVENVAAVRTRSIGFTPNRVPTSGYRLQSSPTASRHPAQRVLHSGIRCLPFFPSWESRQPLSRFGDTSLS